MSTDPGSSAEPVVAIDPVTGRYTEALFQLATERGELERVVQDVERLSSELAAPGVKGYLFDARVPAADKRAKIERLRGELGPLVSSFVGLVFDKKREQVLAGLPAAFRRRLLQSRGAVEGVVESARPLDEGALAALAASLGRRLGKEVQLANRVVAGLVGGVRVLVDGRLIDYSVRGRMADLRRRLMEASLGGSAS